MHKDKEAVIVRGENNEIVWMSEEVQNRLCTVVTIVMAVITTPVFVLALLL